MRSRSLKLTNWNSWPVFFGKKLLLPRSITMQVSLELTMTKSHDPHVAQTVPTLAMGSKWTPSALRHQDIFGHIQQGRKGLGTGHSGSSWYTAIPLQYLRLVVEEVHLQDQAMRCIKAVFQAKQGQWMQWEEVKKRKLSRALRYVYIERASSFQLPLMPSHQHWI